MLERRGGHRHGARGDPSPPPHFVKATLCFHPPSCVFANGLPPAPAYRPVHRTLPPCITTPAHPEPRFTPQEHSRALKVCVAGFIARPASLRLGAGPINPTVEPSRTPHPGRTTLGSLATLFLLPPSLPAMIWSYRCFVAVRLLPPALVLPCGRFHQSRKAADRSGFCPLH